MNRLGDGVLQSHRGLKCEKYCLDFDGKCKLGKEV